MNFQLKFYYDDGKDIAVNMEEKNLPAFFNSLNNHQMYFEEESNVGFWTDLDKIRYIEAFRLKQEEKKEESKEEVDEAEKEEACCA